LRHETEPRNWVTCIVRDEGIEDAVRIHELGVIPNVERFEPELQALGLSDLRVLQQRHVPIIQARTMEESSRRVTDRAERLSTEQAHIEI